MSEPLVPFSPFRTQNQDGGSLILDRNLDAIKSALDAVMARMVTFAVSPDGPTAGAPSSLARYWLSAANTTLPNGVDMSVLGAGMLRQTVALGVATPGIVGIGAGLSFTDPTLRVAANGITDALLRQGVANSVIGRAAGSTGNVADIQSLADGNVLRQTGGVVGWGTIPAASVTGLFYQTVWNATTPLVNRPVLNFSTGLTAVDNSAGAGRTDVTAWLSTGIAGGQTVIGGTGASENLTYSSTTSGTKGAHIWGSTSGMYYHEALQQLILGTATPAANITMQVNKSQNSATSFAFTNPSAGGSAYVQFILGNAVNLGTASFQMTLFGGSSTRTDIQAANNGVFELAGGSANMTFWLDQAAGSIIFATGTAFPVNRRMVIANSGTVTIADLSAGGMVKAAAGTGLLSIAVANTDYLAVPSFTNGSVIFWSGGLAEDNAAFFYDGVTHEFAVRGSGRQSWYNATGANFERVRAIWSGSVWSLTSEKGGAGTVRPMKIDADTATLTLRALAGWSLTSTSVAITAETGGTGHNLTIVGNGTDGQLFATGWDKALFSSTHNSHFMLDYLGPGAMVQGSPTLASAAGAILDAIKLSAGATVTGSTNITTAGGFNHVVIPRPSIVKGDAGAVTVSLSASLYIENAPLAGASITITNRYALWIDDGAFRLDGAVALGGGAGATLGTVGGSGPGAAAQSKWIPINSDGTQYWVPAWT